MAQSARGARERALESLLKTLQGFGIGRLAAILGGAAGVVAILAAVMLKIGGEPKSLLYANLDLKEAGAITSDLDQAGIKYELKGDGATILVDRDKVASARLMLSAKGLPTSGSVGYEIFDNAPALGQTDFVQNLNAKRAMEGELARTIRSIQGVQSARVLLNLPKRQLFEDDTEAPSASIMLTTGGHRLSVDQVRAIRNLVAAGIPNLKPERVASAGIAITSEVPGASSTRSSTGEAALAAGRDAIGAAFQNSLRGDFAAPAIEMPLIRASVASSSSGHSDWISARLRPAPCKRLIATTCAR